MLTHVSVFLLGVLLSPVFRPAMRPLLVELVRAGVTMFGELQRLSAEVREGIEDAVAEAEGARTMAAQPKAAEALGVTPAPAEAETKDEVLRS